MKQKTVIKQAIELLEQQRKSLQEMDLLGVLLENELTYKSNQINTIQLLLAKLLPIEEKQIIDAVEWNYKSNMGQVYYNAVYGAELQQSCETAVSGCYVYAFQYCHCIHESSYATLSLHSTEKGAQIAMEFHKEQKRKEFDEWEKSIEDYSFKFGEDERWNVYRFTILE